MRSSLNSLVRIFKTYWVVIVIIALPAIFFWKTFVKGYVPIPADFIVGVYYPWLDYKWGYEVGVPVKNPIMADVVSFTYPMQTYAIHLLRSGQAPIWNPYILSGTPLLANFQSAPFAITNLVYFFTDDVTGWSIKIILQHLFTLLSVYLLLRQWNVSRLASLFGGTIFAFAGFNIIWSQWSAHALTASCIPILILLTDKWFAKRSAITGVLFALVLGVQILSGYPQVVLYSVFTLFLFWLTKVTADKQFWLNSFILSLFGLLGMGIAAIQLLPARELLSLSQRSVEPHPYEWAFLPWQKIITFFASDYFGNHVTNNYWGPQDYTSTTGFVGVVAASMSILGIVKKSKRVFLILLLVSSLLLSFPTPLSIWIWQSGFVGLQAASAHRALVLTNLSVALLAGFGLDALSEYRRHAWGSTIIPILFIVSFGSVTALLGVIHRSDTEYLLAGTIPWISVALRNLIFPLGIGVVLLLLLLFIKKFRLGTHIVAVLCFLLLTGELFRFGWKFTPMSPRTFMYPTTPVIDYLQKQTPPFRVTGSTVIPINIRMPYELESLEGYDAVYPLQIAKFVAILNKSGTNASPLGRYAIVDNDISPLLSLTNTKYVLTLKKDAKGSPSETGLTSETYPPNRYKEVFSDKTTVVLEDMKAQTRAFVSYDWETITDENALLTALLLQPNGKVFIEKDHPIKPQAGGTSSVAYQVYEPQRSILEVNSSEPGLLFISDAYYPGWRATIDNQPTEILKANYAFRAISVPSGKHIVHMWYEPESYRFGVLITLLSLTICGLTLILSAKKLKSMYTLHK